jgi:hypothetical protein
MHNLGVAMLNPRLMLMTAFISFSALAGVSFDEKKNRVEFLEKLNSKTHLFNIEGYQRELQYEKMGLSLDKRAENETNLLAEKIKVQVQRVYEASLAEMDTEEAIAHVKSAINKDLQLVAPELQEEVKELSLNALDNAQRGGSNSDLNLIKMQSVFLDIVKTRSTYLNLELEDIPTVKKNIEADRKIYENKAELIESLSSSGENIRWISASNISMKSDVMTRAESKISLQVKVSFLGVDVDAGPSISFKRNYGTHVTIMAEGLNPVLLPDGNFDYLMRDKEGKPVVESGKERKRFINFTCNSSLEFETDYSGAGGFTVAGIGGSSSVQKSYSNSVALTSRRILVPEYVGGKSVTFKYLSELCHLDFLKARVSNYMDVRDSLREMMQNLVAGLRFSHPKTKCATDEQCYGWFKKDVLSLARVKNFPRCLEESREKYRACELRGLTGQSCPVYNSKGERISSGQFEYACDRGLKCVKTQQEGRIQGFGLYRYAKGRCAPINKRSYRSPYEKNYIEIELL